MQTTSKPFKVLLQTTIPYDPNDWAIQRFSLLTNYLTSLLDTNGQPLFEVTARNRQNDSDGNDPILSKLDQSDFAELWLFAVDTGTGLSEGECAAITRFRQSGRGLMTTRDHNDLGSSLCTLGGVGPAQYFHSKNPDPDASRNIIDDTFATNISWPNYHSGANGDYQHITATQPLHPLLRNGRTRSGVVERFPAHPHEGGVGVPTGETTARVIATSTSQVTHRPFNLVVAFESSIDQEGHKLGRAVADASFHHFADYNWNPEYGCPTFVTETPGDEVKRDPSGLDDFKVYVSNLALWLAQG